MALAAMCILAAPFRQLCQLGQAAQPYGGQMSWQAAAILLVGL